MPGPTHRPQDPTRVEARNSSADRCAPRSLAVLGDGSAAPQPPEHCLRVCLGTSEHLQDRGCAWLTAAAAGRVDTSSLKGGRCQAGFQVHQQPVSLEGGEGLLVSVRGHVTDELTSGPRVLDQIESINRMLERTARLAEENAGLADEVLRSYEQLNVIFDFTQQIASLTVSGEIEQTLIRRLFELLNAERVELLRHDGTQQRFERSNGADVFVAQPGRVEGYLARLVASVRRTGAISVLGHGRVRTLCGPLKRIDSSVDVVLVRRPASIGEFTSGDLLLMESILTFTGQIIGNSELHERLSRMSLEATRALVAAIDKKDHYTRGHSERVGFLARLTGAEMGLTPDELHVLEWSGMLHDVGKIGVPEEILNKPGRLTPEEFAIIKKHPEMGFEILQPLSSFQSVLDGVLYHHENVDGSGYPRGLSGAQTPLVARIIHVVDVFDALTSQRSYREAYTAKEALGILRNEAGTKLDADTVAAFQRAIAALRQQRPDRYTAYFSHVREDADVVA